MNSNIKASAIFILILVVGVLFGCGNSNNADTETKEEANESVEKVETNVGNSENDRNEATNTYKDDEVKDEKTPSPKKETTLKVSEQKPKEKNINQTSISTKETKQQQTNKTETTKQKPENMKQHAKVENKKQVEKATQQQEKNKQEAQDRKPSENKVNNDKQNEKSPEKKVSKQGEIPIKEQVNTKQPPKASSSHQLNQFERQVVDLTNEERAKHGLPKLSIDTQLSNVARIKSQDMLNNRYFSHNSPKYGSPFDMLKQFGISYRYASENIAKGHRSPNEVVTGWMNSDGHRQNILSKDATHIGVGYVSEGNHWTQMFIKK